jgi:anti-repressor protein
MMKTTEMLYLPVAWGKLGLEVSSRRLHANLGVKTPHKEWIRQRVEKYGFKDGFDYHIVGGSYILTLDTAKGLAVIENTERGRRIRRYFIEWEKGFWENMESVLSKLEYAKEYAIIVKSN